MYKTFEKTTIVIKQQTFDHHSFPRFLLFIYNFCTTCVSYFAPSSLPLTKQFEGNFCLFLDLNTIQKDYKIQKRKLKFFYFFFSLRFSIKKIMQRENKAKVRFIEVWHSENVVHILVRLFSNFSKQRRKKYSCIFYWNYCSEKMYA